ncbi:hypothetical protein H263_03211, partial [Brachyspira hampsonii 30599]
DLYKLYGILSNYKNDEAIKEKYLLKSKKFLQKSADLGYEKAIEKLNNDASK